MTSTRRILLVVALTTFGLVGCDDDGSGGGGSGFHSSLEGSKELGDLTSAEVQTLCDEGDSFASTAAGQAMKEDAKHVGCMLGAVMQVAFTSPTTDDQAQTSCGTTYDECAAEPWDDGDDGTCNAPPADCTATIDELEACVNAYIDQYDQLAADIGTCEELTLADLEDDGGTGENPSDELPAACQTVEDKCPDFFSDDSGTS